MKKYNITVNGNTYEVEVEEVGNSTVRSSGSEVSTPIASRKTQREPLPKAESDKTQEKAAEEKASAIQITDGETSISAPLPGTVLEVRAKEGEQVSEGDIVMILEAMKMENEILAPRAGIIGAIAVNSGDSVNSGDLLATLR